MKIRHKTLAIILVMILAMILVMYGISQLLLVPSFSSLERENVRTETARAVQVISFEQSEVNRIAVEYAYSDEGYAYMASPTSAYIVSKAADDVMANLRLNCLLMFDAAGNLVYQNGFNLSRKKQAPIPEGILSYFGKGSGLLRADKDSGISGLVMTGSGPMLIGAYPIRTTFGFGTPRGTLVVGRYLDDLEIGMLKNVSSIDMALRAYVGGTGGDNQGGDARLLGGAIEVTPVDGNDIRGSALIRDIFGNPAQVLTVDMPRPIYNQGQSSLLYLMLAVLLAGLLLGLMTIFLMERLVVSRIARLGESVSMIGKENDFSGRVPISGDDELSLFSAIINRTMDALESSNQALVSSRRDLDVSEQRFRGLIENINDTIWELDDRTRFTYISPNVIRMLGYEPREVLGKMLWHFISPMYRDIARREFYEQIDTRNMFSLIETVMLHKDGRFVDVEISGAVERDPSGKIVGYKGITRDIRGRKAMGTAMNIMRVWTDILRNTKLPMVILGPDTSKFEMMNPAFADLHGYMPDEMAGMKMEDLIAPDHRDVYRTQLEKAVRVGHLAFENLHLKKGGARLIVQMDITVVKGDDGNVWYHIITCSS